MRPDQEQEFCEYVAAQSQRLCRFAYLCCADWHRAEDAVQTALTRLYGRWGKGGLSSVDGYVRRIIVNILIDERRLFRFRKERTQDTLPERPAHDASARTDSRVMLVDALHRLPKRQRAAIVLRYWEDLPVEQTAHILGCSTGAVKNLTMRGLHALRGLMTDPVLETLEGVQ